MANSKGNRNGAKGRKNFYGQVKAKNREKHVYSNDLAKEAVKVVEKKMEGGVVDFKTVLEKAEQIQRVGADGKKVGRSSMEKSVKDIVASIKKAEPAKPAFAGDDGVMVLNSSNKKKN